MAQKITFTFPTSTIIGTNYRVLRLTSNGTTVFDSEPIFVNSSITGNDPYTFTPPDNTSYVNNIIIKGASINNFANNFKLWLDAQLSFNGSIYYETTITGNIVELIWGSNSETNDALFVDLSEDAHDEPWLLLAFESYTIITPIVPEVLPQKIILSRSPFHFKVSPGITFDEITAEIFIYRGHKIDDRPLVSTYNISKSVVQVGQSAINFDIHKLVNDYVKNVYSGVGLSGAFTTSLLDSVWVYIDAKINLAGVEQYQANQVLLAIDGFGYHTDLANPEISTLPNIIYRRQKVLTSIDNHIIYNDSDYPLYFITNGLVSLTVNGTNIPFTFSQDYSNQNIGYVNIKNYIGSSTSFSVLFFYDGSETPSVTINFTIKDECKFPLMNCIFKNKFGVWQTIPFNKLSKKSQDFTNESYNGLISNYGNYALNKHVKQTFNVNGKEKITVNTDFIPEEYNLLFTELMLSEFIYLEENGTVLPVNLMKNTFEKKTKLNNKLIQYSMDFEYSFNLLNNII
jgi:hypothetical protein